MTTSIFLPIKEDIKCLINITIILVITIVKIICGVWTNKHWSYTIYEFINDLFLCVMYVLSYREGISTELKYEAVLGLITTLCVLLGIIFLIG